MVTSSSSTAPPTQVQSTSTTAISTVLNTLQGFNWAQISDLVEGKGTIQEGVTTVEELAETLVQGATVLGVPFAGTIETFMPVAFNLLNFAENFMPVAQGVQGSVQAASTTVSNSPSIKTGR